MSVEVKGNSTAELYQTNLNVRQHQFLVDEPLDKGGKDTAATPMELIGAALSSCTIITLQMYFNHKQWEYDLVEVDVDFDYTVSPIIFKRKINLKGTFDEKQQKRITSIANACPVHKLLEKGNEIVTEVNFL